MPSSITPKGRSGSDMPSKGENERTAQVLMADAFNCWKQGSGYAWVKQDEFLFSAYQAGFGDWTAYARNRELPGYRFEVEHNLKNQSTVVRIHRQTYSTVYEHAEEESA